jgi:hypothetical protein
VHAASESGSNELHDLVPSQDDYGEAAGDDGEKKVGCNSVFHRGLRQKCSLASQRDDAGSSLRPRSWCMLDSSCCLGRALGWPSSGSGSCSPTLLALFSLPSVHNAMGPRLWRISLVIALNYIALVFAADFIEGPLKRGGIASFPLTYLPFALMLVVGVGLRAAAFFKLLWRPKQRVVGAS